MLASGERGTGAAAMLLISSVFLAAQAASWNSVLQQSRLLRGPGQWPTVSDLSRKKPGMERSGPLALYSTILPTHWLCRSSIGGERTATAVHLCSWTTAGLRCMSACLHSQASFTQPAPQVLLRRFSSHSIGAYMWSQNVWHCVPT